MAKQDDEVPGLTLEPGLEAKLDGLDEHLNPIKDQELHESSGSKGTKAPSQGATDEDTEEEDNSEQAGESADKTEKKSESEENGGEKPKDGDEPDEGYTIDEGEEEQKPEEKPAEKQEASRLNPEQQYIIDNLEPITVRGTIGAESEIKEYKVYSPEYLPQGFKFVDDREMSAANKAFASLEQRAQQLQTDYRGQETQKAAKDFKQREDTADRQDIATLQKAGELPRFKVQPNSADFDKDPGVQLVQEVLDFKETRNAKYMEEYNAGRPYRHIGFEEAFRMFRRDNPSKSNPAQQQEDKDRTEIAKRTSKTTGTSSKGEQEKIGVHSGMTSMDLDNLIESKTAGW